MGFVGRTDGLSSGSGGSVGGTNNRLMFLDLKHHVVVNLKGSMSPKEISARAPNDKENLVTNNLISPNSLRDSLKKKITTEGSKKGEIRENRTSLIWLLWLIMFKYDIFFYIKYIYF